MYSNGTIDTRATAGSAGARKRGPSVLAPPRAAAAWSRRATWYCIVLGVALLSPSLRTGLVADDYLHELMLRADPGLRGLRHGPLDLFRFADGQPETARMLIDDGVFPWWADPKALLAFFRPLASFTHYADHRLWPSHPALMHAHSLAWYGVLIAVVAALYRRFGVQPRAFFLGLLLFAIDDAHAPVVGWVANRNAMIALCVALPALAVHDRQRRSGFVHGVWLGPCSFSLGLLGGEVALAVMAYLVAYAACLDRGPWATRYGALLPYAVVLASWKACCIHLGYGAHGSGLYVDPFADPIGFARAACERLPVLGLALFAGPFADLWELYPLVSPWLRVGVLATALLVVGLLTFALYPLLLRDARLRFWALGAALCLVPMCATFPHDRLLIGPGIGGMALIAALLEAGWARREHWLPALGTAALAGVHLVAAPVLGPWRAASVGRFSELLRRTDATLPGGPDVREQTVILLNPPLDPFAAYLPVYREVSHAARPRQQLWLATGVSDLLVSTLDGHSLSLRPEHGFLSSSVERMLRGDMQGLQIGARVQLEGASVQVTDVTDDGRPLQVVVRFERELADPSLVWARWRAGHYERFQPPPIGESELLPRAEIFHLLFAS